MSATQPETHPDVVARPPVEPAGADQPSPRAEPPLARALSRAAWAATVSLSGFQRTANVASPARRTHWARLAQVGVKLKSLQGLHQLRTMVGGENAGRTATATVFGQQVTAPSWWDLSFLYGEVFIGQDYHFEADTERPFIVDCGANIGMASLYFKYLYPHCRILAFEPNPAVADLFDENVRANGLTDVRLERVALCDQDDTTIDLYVDPSLAGGLTSSTDPNRLGGSVNAVPAKRLSTYLDEPVDLLKLDVEGAEHEVLHDLVRSGTLANVRRMAIEYHHHISSDDDRLGRLLSLLEDAGCGYQVSTKVTPSAAGSYQDIAIDVYHR